MTRFGAGAGGLLLLLLASVAVAQSPGSIESHFKYAREYMEARSWFYAKLEYESILRKDPGNAEAQRGYDLAKAKYDAQEAAKAAQARALSPARPSNVVTPATEGSTKGANKGANRGGVRPKGPQSKRAICDDLFGTCYAIYKSIPRCASERAQCYTRNGVK